VQKKYALEGSPKVIWREKNINLNSNHRVWGMAGEKRGGREREGVMALYWKAD